MIHRQGQARKAFFVCSILAVLVLCTPYPVYEASHDKKRSTSVKQPPKGKRPQNTPPKEVVSAGNDSIWEVQPLSYLTASSKNGTDTASDQAAQSRTDTAGASVFFSNAAPDRFLRVVLSQNQKRALLSSTGRIEIRCADRERVNAQGPLSFEISSVSERVLFSLPKGGKRECSLPCTLWSHNELNIIQFNGTSYRGSMILAAERHGFFSVINYCNVEDYLRGVIPLEIGNCGMEDIEAIKAQAVAARTYTYKKIQDCTNLAFDLLPDVSDQMYGGVNAEKTICNQAIRETSDLVIVYPTVTSEGIKRDSLIFAYYHSTCGGRTANIEDVWEKPKLPYLRSIEDRDENGRPFCIRSLYYSWVESWPIEQLSKIVNRHSREAFPQNPASGTIKDIVIGDRYACGRTRTCRIKTTKGTFTYGGDKLRFILRRKASGFPALRSAVISEVSKKAGTLFIKGRGYGHGVGMCQSGALGRARAGQNYEQIVKAYYTGVEIRKIGGKK